MKTNRTRKAADAPVQKPFADRPLQPPVNRGRSRAPVTPAELAAWVRKAKDLPDIRWDKVQAMREAILSGDFDVNDRLVKLSEKFPDELIEYLQQLGQPEE